MYVTTPSFSFTPKRILAAVNTNADMYPVLNSHVHEGEMLLLQKK